MNENKLLFLKQNGGKEALQKAADLFYDKLFKHQRLGLLFIGSDKKVLSENVVNFIHQTLGGSSKYTGLPPQAIHKHMFITEELFEIRTKLLKDSFKEQNLSSELLDAWIKIENAFRSSIVKKSIQDCEYAPRKL